MERSDEPATAMLAQLSPILEVVFYACGLSDEEAEKIVRDSCVALILKRRQKDPDPTGWLLWMIVQRCRARVLGKEEEDFEDPPE